MEEIERRFNYVQRKNPHWSTFTCFANTIRGKYFSKKRIQVGFDEFVDKNEYAKNEKWQILKYLYKSTRDNL
jgi:hypothetical protein